MSMDITIEYTESAFRHGESQEAWELDDLLTRTDPELGPNGTGYLTMLEARQMGLDNLSINYLITKASEAHTTPAQIIGEMVRERIAVGI